MLRLHQRGHIKIVAVKMHERHRKRSSNAWVEKRERKFARRIASCHWSEIPRPKERPLTNSSRHFTYASRARRGTQKKLDVRARPIGRAKQTLPRTWSRILGYDGPDGKWLGSRSHRALRRRLMLIKMLGNARVAMSSEQGGVRLPQIRFEVDTDWA